MATAHATDPDWPASGKRRDLAADQIKIAHAIEVLVICHTSGAITEAELGTEIDVYFAAAFCGPALERPTSSPLIQGKRPSHFGPRGWAKRFVLLVQENRTAEYGKAGRRGGERHDGCDGDGQPAINHGFPKPLSSLPKFFAKYSRASTRSGRSASALPASAASF